MLSTLPFTLTVLLYVCSNAFAVPHANAGISMNLKRRSRSPKSQEEVMAWAKNHRDRVAAKYSNNTRNAAKRTTGTNLLVNQNYDSSFYGSIAVGTPAVSFDVILDTGSADLWLASGGNGFNPTGSTSFVDKSTEFSIEYGVGFASGTLGQDVVQMAGFQVANQLFGVCDNVADGLLNDPVQGLMGLAFQTIASSKATPFWQSLAENGAWDSPLMSFQLTRYTDDADADVNEPGGTFTMGFVNNTLFTGDIDYQPLSGGTGTYWLQSLSSLTINGNAVTLGTGDDLLAAIDTGTTLIGGPQDAVSEIYAQIPGSQAGQGQLEGYYTYPCETSVSVTVAFGGKTWTIDPADFPAQQVTHSECMGAFFVTPGDGSAPAWIFGDTFLKNVYSVYQFNPPAVGFAQLSKYALSLNGADGPVPTPTIGSIVAEVSATGTIGGTRMHSGAIGQAIGRDVRIFVIWTTLTMTMSAVFLQFL